MSLTNTLAYENVLANSGCLVSWVSRVFSTEYKITIIVDGEAVSYRNN